MAVTIEPTADVPAASQLFQSATRFRFVPAGSDANDIYCRFADPLAMVAVRETVAPDASIPCWPESIDQLDVVTASNRKPLDEKIVSWVSSPEHPDAPGTLVITKGDLKIHWRPGRAVLRGSTVECNALLPGLVEFSFFESQLRRLEQLLLPFEATSDADVSLAYEMTTANRPHWGRLYRTMEQLYRLRLRFARLEPHLHRPSAAMSGASRALFNRLAAKASTADRLEAVSNRLETIEDLYEGAVDRITDFKAYRHGSLLEIIIIGLLAMETILLIWQGHLGR